MQIAIRPEKRGEFEERLPTLAPFMHAYKFGPETIVGYFKYEGLTFEQTFCTPQSPREDIERLQRAYAARDASERWAFYEGMIASIPREDRSKMTVLDIASATGEFSFWAVDQGFGRVISSEIRPEQVEQQRLIIDSAENNEYREKIEVVHEPISADVPEFVERYAAYKPDVVFSFGLLYHLSNPVQHLVNLRDLAGRCALLYTQTHNIIGAENAWVMKLERPEQITKAVGGVNWRPHFTRLPQLAVRLGFREGHIFYPARFARHFPDFADYTRATRWKMRMADIAAKVGVVLGHHRNFKREHYQFTSMNPIYFGYVLEK